MATEEARRACSMVSAAWAESEAGKIFHSVDSGIGENGFLKVQSRRPEAGQGKQYQHSANHFHPLQR